MRRQHKHYHPRRDVKCAITGKIIFKSQEAAIQRGVGIFKDDEFRAYLCPHCQFWHLTTKVD